MGLSALSAYRGDIVQARAARAAGFPIAAAGQIATEFDIYRRTVADQKLTMD